MKKYYTLLIIIVVVFSIYSCEKTEIGLNKAGDLASFTGTWKTDNSYIAVTSYTKTGTGPDFTYPSTTATDSTSLTFQFGAVRIDSVRVTAVKTLNKQPQTPVNLPAGRWSFTIGTSTGDEMSGSDYFIVCQTDFPNNYETGYGTIYTYKMISSASMEIRWVITDNNLSLTKRCKALLIKQ